MPLQWLVPTQQGNPGIFAGADSPQPQTRTGPLQTDGVERFSILAASKPNRTILAGDGTLSAIFGAGFGKGNVVTLFPQIARARTGFVNRFTVHFQQSYYKSGYMAGAEVAADNYWPFVFYPDGKLSGSRDNGASSVALPRLQ